MNKAIEVNRLSFKRELEYILKDISFSVAEGEFVLLTGENGSGKTTLLRTLLGLEQLDSGSVWIFGDELSSFKNYGDIGYLPQNPFQQLEETQLTVSEFITSGYLGVGNLQEKIDELDIVFNVKKFKDSLLRNLSGGQLQRVFLTRSLINSPRILFLDEPTSSIDRSSTKNLYELLRTLKKTDLTIITVTHDTSTFEPLADRTICLKICEKDYTLNQSTNM